MLLCAVQVKQSLSFFWLFFVETLNRNEASFLIAELSFLRQFMLE